MLTTIAALAVETVEMAPRTGMGATKYAIALAYAGAVITAAMLFGRLGGFLVLFGGLFVIGAIWPPGPQPVEQSSPAPTEQVVDVGEGS